MGTRGSSDSISTGCGCLLLFLLIGVVGYIGLDRIIAIGGVLLVVLIAGVIALYSYNKNKKQVFLKNAKALIQSHSKTLNRRKKILLHIDDYGVVDDSKWQNEKEHFIENVIFEQLGCPLDITTDESGFKLEKLYLELDGTIEGLLEELGLDEMADYPSNYEDTVHDVESTFSENPRPAGVEYEIMCIERFQQCGWEARSTATSGDQGVDIVASKNGVTIAVQCKCYNSPVGNKAVQEAVASKKYVGADYAAVVTNSNFTRSAEELARANHVLLLHDSQIEDLEIE